MMAWGSDRGYTEPDRPAPPRVAVVTAGSYGCRLNSIKVRITSVEDGICYGMLERGGRKIGTSEWSEIGGKNAYHFCFDLTGKLPS